MPFQSRKGVFLRIIVSFLGLLVCLQFFQLIRLTSKSTQADHVEHSDGSPWTNATKSSTAVCPTPQQPKKSVEASSSVVHVLQGLSGNKTGFLDQWQVTLKSILVNAPLDQPLHLHILVNQVARQALFERLTNIPLNGSRWRQPIRITVYNVEAYSEEWNAFVLQKLRGAHFSTNTLGAYYRLLSQRMLLPYWNQRNVSINAILYMDADVVILNNLANLWKNIPFALGNVPREQGIPQEIVYNLTRPPYNRSLMASLPKPPLLFQWMGGGNPNSGFVVFFLRHMDTFWDLLDAVPDLDWGSDQVLMTKVAQRFRRRTTMLAKDWAVHLGHYWYFKPHLLAEYRIIPSMMHFTGKPPKGQTFWDSPMGVKKYCYRVPKCHSNGRAQKQFEQSWQLVEFYVHMPWEQVLQIGASQVEYRDGDYRGNDLQIEFVDF